MRQQLLSLFVIATSAAYVAGHAPQGGVGITLDAFGKPGTADPSTTRPAGPLPSAGVPDGREARLAPSPTDGSPAPPDGSVPATIAAASDPAPRAATPLRAAAVPPDDVTASIAETPAPPAAIPTSDRTIVASAVLPLDKGTNSQPDPSQPRLPPLSAIPVPTPRPDHPLRVASASPAGTAPQPPVPAPTTRASFAPQGLYNDGSYRGSVANAYYGLVQVEAVVRNGRLASVHILRYPNDRQTSRHISGRALPVLEREAIASQSANVDIISGATLVSRAYRRSLDSALSKARA